MLCANLKMWRDAHQLDSNDSALGRHGTPPAKAIDAALLEAVQGLILPGFERFGLATNSLRAWVAAGAPTP
jgi:hypothetical protein